MNITVGQEVRLKNDYQIGNSRVVKAGTRGIATEDSGARLPEYTEVFLIGGRYSVGIWTDYLEVVE